MALSRGLRQSDVLSHVDRFMAYVEPDDSGCWFRYSRARNSGYTSIVCDGRSLGSHRFAYAAFVGDIPAGMEIDHTCRDRACVNPEHLELVDRATNLARRDDVTPAQFGTGSVAERLELRSEVDGECRVWTGALVRGYGVLSIDNRTQYAHRVAWELKHGTVPEGLDLDHTCRNPRCINVEHLEPVTRGENVRRMLDAQPRDRCRYGHYIPEAGRTRNGTCIACWEASTGRKYQPRRTDTDVRCANGHEYAHVGRYPSGGCRACQAQVDAERGQRANAEVERYCSRGHDLVQVGMRGRHCQGCWDEGWCVNGHRLDEVGRTANGDCTQCRRETIQRYSGRDLAGVTCPSGHDLGEVGVNPANGECRECAREYARRKYGYQRTAEELQFVCRNGHPRTPENTRTIRRVRDGAESVETVCVPCARERSRAYSERKSSR